MVSQDEIDFVAACRFPMINGFTGVVRRIAHQFVNELNHALTQHSRIEITITSKAMRRAPGKEEIRKAANKTIRDVIAPNLKILFCGINPGLYSAAVGHNFARPGNRFWPALFGAKFTDQLLSPYQERKLLDSGYGITNIVERATASADELSKDELIQGGKQLISKVRKYTPAYLAVVGLGAYRTAFQFPKAKIGLQEIKINNTLVWVLPNPSGLNAHHQLPDLIKHFSDLRLHSLKMAT